MRLASLRSAGLVGMIGLIAACTAGAPGASSTIAPTPALSRPPPQAQARVRRPAPPQTTTCWPTSMSTVGRCTSCASGRPTPGVRRLVFESGLGGDAGQWGAVLHELGGTGRACSYDRAGVGQSEPATVGRTTKEQVADLRALLTAADVEPPYLLAGFSLRRLERHGPRGPVPRRRRWRRHGGRSTACRERAMAGGAASRIGPTESEAIGRWPGRRARPSTPTRRSIRRGFDCGTARPKRSSPTASETSR